MKKFLKRVSWKKFFKYELITLLIIGALYANSVFQGKNIFPENFYIVFLIPVIFGFMMLLKAHTRYIENKIIRK